MRAKLARREAECPTQIPRRVNEMAVTTTVNSYPSGTDYTQRNQVIRGTFAIAAGNYPSGGFSLTWATEQIKSLPNSATTGPFPIDVDVKSVSNPPSGYIYQWDNVAGNLHVFESAAENASAGPLVELVASAAIPAAVVAD